MLLDAPGYDIENGMPTMDFLVGINTDGAPCGAPHKPDVYVDLRAHAAWINEKISANNGLQLTS